MDFSTWLMMLISFGVVIFGIRVQNLINFYDRDSIFIVVIATVAIIGASFPFSTLKKIPQHMKVISRKDNYKPEVIIDKVFEYSQEARRKGLLALEEMAANEADMFLKNSIMLVVDATEADKLQEMLEGELERLEQRHSEAWQIYDRGASLGPAFGMIGTLIGLINMLKGMDDMENGSSDLGPAMSVALITTMYGSVLANMVFTPISNKLKAKHTEEMNCKEMIMVGVLAIQFGENPTHVKDKMLSFLEESKRDGKEKNRKQK